MVSSERLDKYFMLQIFVMAMEQLPDIDVVYLDLNNCSMNRHRFPRNTVFLLTKIGVNKGYF